MSKIEELAEKVAFSLSSSLVKECVISLRRGDEWLPGVKGLHRIKPYPMGFYLDDPRLYYALGWGNSEHMFPHERWLVRRVAGVVVP